MASLYEIVFEPTHLTEEELNYELKLRNISPTSNTRNNTKKLRECLIKESKGIYVKPKFTEDASSEVTQIKLKLEELDLSMMGLEELPHHKEIIEPLISRFLHTLLRLQRIPDSKNAIMTADVNRLDSRITKSLSHLEKLKTGKHTSQVNTITEQLNNTVLGPRSGASDVMALNYELASNVTAPPQILVPVPNPILASSVVPETGNRSLGAYPKTSVYSSPDVTQTVNTRSPIFSTRECVMGRGRGSNPVSREINRSIPRQPFNDKLYYPNHSYVPPVTSSVQFSSSSVNNPNSLMNFAPSPISYSNFDYPPPYYNQTQPQSIYNPPPPISSSVSIPSSNNNNFITQQNIMSVPFSNNQQSVNNYIQRPLIPRQPIPLNPVNPVIGPEQPEMLQRPFYNRNPVSGWNLFFSGEPNSRSLYDFLSRVEMLARAEHISEESLRRSAYYLFTGAAMTWYRAFEQYLLTWTDLVNALKNQFIPLDYDRALLREIDKRKQGATESFGMYLANMEMLYRGIQRTTIPEIVKLDTIMRNMLPYLTEKLMLTDVNTLQELSNYCRRIENTQFRMAQMNLPNDHKYLLEPQFAYKAPGNEQKDAVPRLGGQYPRK